MYTMSFVEILALKPDLLCFVEVVETLLVDILALVLDLFGLIDFVEILALVLDQLCFVEFV